MYSWFYSIHYAPTHLSAIVLVIEIIAIKKPFKNIIATIELIEPASVNVDKANDYIAVATTIIDASKPKAIIDIMNLLQTF